MQLPIGLGQLYRIIFELLRLEHVQERQKLVDLCTQLELLNPMQIVRIDTYLKHLLMGLQRGCRHLIHVVRFVLSDHLRLLMNHLKLHLSLTHCLKQQLLVVVVEFAQFVELKLVQVELSLIVVGYLLVLQKFGQLMLKLVHLHLVVVELEYLKLHLIDQIGGNTMRSLYHLIQNDM